MDANEWIARYSGDPLTRKECDERQHSQYRVQIHKNLFLDAADRKHFEGRFINDARGSRFKTNARFASNYATNRCTTTGFTWVRIYATRKIRAGEEIFIDYGDQFWEGLKQSTTPMAKLAASSAASPIADTSSSSDMWAASAPMPDLTPDSNPQFETDAHADGEESGKQATQQTMTWATQLFAPATPAILGHSNSKTAIHTTTPIHFSTPLSPIIPHTSPNPNTHMNEIYSFTQLNNLDDTILLPLKITNPMNVTITKIT